MRLPNGDRADLGTKLEDYVLNPRHREGRHKARLFESALGITLANTGVLRQAILSAAENSEDAEPFGNNGHGELYVLRFALETERERDCFDGVDCPRRRRLSAPGNLLYTLNMLGEIKVHDVIALLQDLRTKHFESGRALLLRRGQIGTVVMSYPDGAYDVEFADRDGRAFAILSLRPEQLMVLRDNPDFVAA